MPLCCKTCPFTDSFWGSALGTPDNEKLLLRHYYRHEFMPDCFDASLKLCAASSEFVCNVLIQVLEKYTCREIIDIISEDFKPHTITSADIPQFSDLYSCYHSVPDVLVRSDLESASYLKLGFLLRRPNETRNKIADTKYGENQGKTAVQLGLCYLDASYSFRITAIGRYFYGLTSERQESLLPKLCLYLPILQNYYYEGAQWPVMEKYMTILKPSTANRRAPNVRTLIEKVNFAIENEL